LQTKYSLSSKLSEIEQQVKELLKDNQYYVQRINSLTSSLANAVEIPDISQYTSGMRSVKPYNLLHGYKVLAADASYITFTEENWHKILSLIQPKVVKVLKEWRNQISDCDDWALLMSSFIVWSCVKSNLYKQAAFCIIWSSSHAYNGYITTENKIYIYEPQTNKKIGRLGKTKPPYDSKFIWFMG